MDTVKFTHLKNCDEEDIELLERLSFDYAGGTGHRVLELLGKLEDSSCGLQVTRLSHSLQSGTRAWLDGADNDWVVAAVLHDIGDLYAPFNHDEYAALILKPFVREQCTKTVQFHGDFQKYYYNDKIGKDRNVRERYKESIYFDDCVDFCERWDQNCFDPSYKYFPIDFFKPIVLDVFSRPPYDPKRIQPGIRMPLVDPNQSLARKASRSKSPESYRQNS